MQKSQQNLKCIVGLGNPGTAYDNTRHNIGFMLLDNLADYYNFTTLSKKFDGYFTSGFIRENSLILFKPATYMNKSGNPLLKLISFYKILPSELLVIHDDVELDLGRVKVKIGGGHGGHNGLKSIDSMIGKDYWRLRIGVSRPELGDLSNYVLSRFKPEDNINHFLDNIVLKFHLLFTEDKNLFVQAMTETIR